MNEVNDCMILLVIDVQMTKNQRTCPLMFSHHNALTLRVVHCSDENIAGRVH